MSKPKWGFHIRNVNYGWIVSYEGSEHVFTNRNDLCGWILGEKVWMGYPMRKTGGQISIHIPDDQEMAAEDVKLLIDLLSTYTNFYPLKSRSELTPEKPAEEDIPLILAESPVVDAETGETL